MKPIFRPGASVIVSNREVDGHKRTPTYIHGKSGVIERFCGSFRNPESLAYGGDGLPRQPLYRVRFLQSHVWPEYQGSFTDTVDIEIYQHWLEPVS